MRNFLKTLIVLVFVLVSHNVSATERYVSKLGSDANAPCTGQDASACLTVAQCITSSGTTGDTCNIGAGTYSGAELGSAGYALMSGKNVSLRGQASSSVTFVPSVTTGGIRLNGAISYSTTTITDIAVAGTSTNPNYCYWFQDNTASIYSVVLKNSTCTNPAIYGIYSSANLINVQIENATTTTNLTTTRTHFFTEKSGNQWQQGLITMNGGGFVSTAHAGGSFPAVNITSQGATTTAEVRNQRISITSDTSTTGDTGGIWIYNVGRAKISGNVASVFVPNATTSTQAVLYRIASCGTSISAGSGGCGITLTPQPAGGSVIENNYGYSNTAGGGMAMIGNDFISTSAFFANDAIIKNNKFYCTRSSGSNTIHGTFLGYLDRGLITGNTIEGCGLGLITKDTLNALVAGNLVKNAWIYYANAKGATSTTFANNTLIAQTGTGTPFYLSDDTERGATSSQLTVIKNNIIYGAGATPTYLFDNSVSASNGLLSADANDWYGFDTPQWKNGSTYTTLGTWNADSQVGTDLSVDPRFRNYPYSLHLSPTSPLLNAGVRGKSYSDTDGKFYDYKPSIGGYEYGSRDFILNRSFAL